MEVSLDEAHPDLARRVNTEMPALGAADRRRGFVTFRRHWSDLVFPQTAPLPLEMGVGVDVASCPGEYVAASFAIRALRDLDEVSVAVGDLTREDGHRVDRANLDVRLVRCLPTKVWNSRTFVIRPRILESRRAIDIAGGTTQQFWLTVFVPESTKPGAYATEITVRPANADPHTVIVRLGVWPFRLDASPVDHYVYAYMFGDPLTDDMVLRNLLNMRAHGMTGAYFAFGHFPKLARVDGASKWTSRR